VRWPRRLHRLWRQRHAGKGREVRADHDSRAVLDDRESAGRRLLRLVFGSDGAGLTAYADEVFESDPGKAAQAAEVIAGFYRGQAAAGRVEALVDLGDLLYWDDPQAARAAYQEAVEARHLPALLGLAAEILTSPPRRCISWRCKPDTKMKTPRGHCSSR
jgi:hypothetical protein